MFFSSIVTVDTITSSARLEVTSLHHGNGPGFSQISIEQQLCTRSDGA